MRPVPTMGGTGVFNSDWDDRHNIARNESIRRDFTQRSRGGRKPPGPLLWLAFGVAILVASAIGFGPSISAAEGHGTRGYFVARTQTCDRGGCSWGGQFRLPGGKVTRSGVGFSGNESGMRAGTVVPALDAGDRHVVFARHGDLTWLGDLITAAIAMAIIALAIRKLLKRRRASVEPTSVSVAPARSR